MILVTGGCGYIGSHTVLSLLESGYEVVVLDSLVNSSRESLNRVAAIVGKSINFVEGDIRDSLLLERLFKAYDIDSVIHFAGLKAVGESIVKPLEYFEVNVGGSIALLQVMANNKVKRIVFSSSATVYGLEASMPYVETLSRGTTSNPYGASKSMVERILEDQFVADPSCSIAILRYFNPIGAHSSGMIGEDPRGIPNNLMPVITQVAGGRLEKVYIFGGDYPTFDGTCRRDYLHVMDLALGHVKALMSLSKKGCSTYNLGSGTPVSVLELVKAFEVVTGVKIPYEIVGRREGDLAEFWADPSKASEYLGWKTKRSLEDMIADTWLWQCQNPSGYCR